jgi:hypothetical protein
MPSLLLTWLPGFCDGAQRRMNGPALQVIANPSGYSAVVIATYGMIQKTENPC